VAAAESVAHDATNNGVLSDTGGFDIIVNEIVRSFRDEKAHAIATGIYVETLGPKNGAGERGAGVGSVLISAATKLMVQRQRRDAIRDELFPTASRTDNRNHTAEAMLQK
jgi:hypothetical protein